jgi:chromosome segregation protein
MGRVRLESLKLTGFKSFPDSVDLAFPGDVSAIIGPNGCGKSNLVDAILWVIGEQSPTLLRLKNMGDVVFSGAAGRPAAGAAEVTLVLSSDDGRWADSDDRLELRRRVYRSGPSEYRINGRTARLKDIADELMSVGLGTRDYAIIEQGRVGQVLSARPTDRRALIEEAAGITRYKARKHESELKLEHTRQNLIRLDDVISEVDRSLRQLRRQARQAERHQRLGTELRERLETLLVLEAHALDGRRTDARRRRGEAQNEVAAAASALGGADADLSAARKALDGGRAEVEEARVEVSKLLNSRERLEAFLERSADLLDTLRASLDRTGRERASLASNRAALDETLVAAGRRLEDKQAEHARVRHTVTEAETAARGAKARLVAAETASGTTKQELLRTISALTDTRNRLGDLEREQDRLAYALTQLEQERERLTIRRNELDSRFAEASTASAAAAVASERLDDQRASLAAERSALNDRAAAAKREAETLGHSAWELRHRLAGVTGELARHAAARDQLAPELPEGAILGQVSDWLAPEAGLASLLDHAWRDWLELPVVAISDLEPTILERLATHEGRLRMVLADDAPDIVRPSPPAGAEDLLALAGADDTHLPWLTRTLPPTWRVADSETARRLADAHPEALVIGPDEVLRSGRVVEPPATAGRSRGALELREEQRILTAEIEATASRAEASLGEHQKLSQGVHEIAERLATLDTERVQAEQERARTATVEQSLGQELSRLERELAALDAEERRDRAARDDLNAKQERLQQEVAASERRSLDLEQAVEATTSDLDTQREASSEATRRLDRWRSEKRLAAERETAARTEHDRLESDRQSMDARQQTLATEQDKLGRELTTTEDEVVRSRGRLAEEQGLLTAAKDRERQLGDSVQAQTAKVAKLEQEVKQRREAHEKVREVLHTVEMELTRLDGDWDRLRDQAATELGLAPEELLRREPPEGEDPTGLRSTITDLRDRLDKLGPVNLLALKEVEELEERSTFLSAQRTDLVESLKSLDATIREIDATCTERFVATFEQVNAVLAETFSHLFGGGTARLDLVDEDNPLESGIDITAQPPGKKNQSVQLLSGGEKALTALSLLISLFRIKPSPFCLLDEVDAPLDDANVERLADLVASMTEHTQFVLITHNRRTMQRADILYGVTMEEPGVSKLVSVRLD